MTSSEYRYSYTRSGLTAEVKGPNAGKAGLPFRPAAAIPDSTDRTRSYSSSDRRALRRPGWVGLIQRVCQWAVSLVRLNGNPSPERVGSMRHAPDCALCRLLLLFAANLGFCCCINDLLAAFDTLEQDCPGWKDKSLASVKVPWGAPRRAFLTVPPGLSVQPSLIPGAGLGVISWTFIPKYTWLAEYEGEVVTDSSKISHYTWQVQRNADPDYLIDGHDVATSNWLRFLNCPRGPHEENVEVMECFGKIYYITTKDIVPGTELLVYYGDTYAKELNIDTTKYYTQGG